MMEPRPAVLIALAMQSAYLRVSPWFGTFLVLILDMAFRADRGSKYWIGFHSPRLNEPGGVDWTNRYCGRKSS